MNIQEQQAFDALRAKNVEYELVIEKLLQETKTVGTIISLPFVEDGTTYYRVATENKSIIASYNGSIFNKNTSKIELKTQVIVINGQIAGIVPGILEETKKAPTIKLVSWNEIGGLKSQIEMIRTTIELPLKHAKLAKKLGLPFSKGMLLYGPPGCGKTYIAKAIASAIIGSVEVDPRSFVYIKGAEILSKYVGETENRITSIFKSCREYHRHTGKQTVLFIDEADAIMPKRGSRISSDVESTIMPVFLSEMDGFEDGNPFVLLSTNLPNSLDDAILREGRIDIKINISRPSKEDCLDIFKIHLSKVKCSSSIDLLAELGTNLLFSSDLSKRVSGAMVKTIVDSSLRLVLKRIVENKDNRVGIIETDISNTILNITSHERTTNNGNGQTKSVLERVAQSSI
jgi:SpoVK/Ycf46/Vps4 family AAA+-type ATPase